MHNATREIRHEPWQLRLRSTSAVLAGLELPGWQGGGPLKRSEQRRAPRGARPNKERGTRHLQQPRGGFAGGTRQTVGTPTATAWCFSAEAQQLRLFLCCFCFLPFREEAMPEA